MAKRILVVDDEINISEPLQEFLEENGYEIQSVNTGKKALELFNKSISGIPFDLILLDIIMPRMSGLEVLDTIRKSEKNRNVVSKDAVKIIMISGMKESWMNDAFRDGCNDYIVKPYDLDFLLMRVKEMLGERD